jgi:hypothetical protein
MLLRILSSKGGAGKYWVSMAKEIAKDYSKNSEKIIIPCAHKSQGFSGSLYL